MEYITVRYKDGPTIEEYTLDRKNRTVKHTTTMVTEHQLVQDFSIKFYTDCPYSVQGAFYAMEEDV